jgi:hypothetical protein
MHGESGQRKNGHRRRHTQKISIRIAWTQALRLKARRPETIVWLTRPCNS